MSTRPIEQFLKSFAFTLLCFLIWGALSISHIRRLIAKPSPMEAVWVSYNMLIAVLFLIRARPSHVSTNPLHWAVALITSFSGFFFRAEPSAAVGENQVECVPLLCARWWGDPHAIIADSFILIGLLGSGLAGLALRRNYDFLPAVRGLSTDSLYRFVRHPMYLFSLLIRLGYVVKHPLAYNMMVYAALIALYVLRAHFEEQVMSLEPRYADYVRRVRYRFLPGLW
jgi:protein-S-isoprenylcysteine O-methyltransferase Ste14